MKNKSFLVKLLALLFASTCIFAEESMQTLFSGEAKYSGFGAPFMQSITVGDTTKYAIGGLGAVLVNDAFYFGGYGFGTGIDEDTSFGSGGIVAGYNISSSSLIHPHIFALLGSAGVGGKNASGEKINQGLNYASVHLGAQINLAKWMRISANIGYRNVLELDGGKYSKDDLNKITTGVMVLFGYWNK